MIKFVDDVKSAWRWFSTWLIAVSGSLIIAYENFPQLKEYVPDKWFHTIMGIMLALIFLGRVIKQSPAAPTAPVAPVQPAP